MASALFKVSCVAVFVALVAVTSVSSQSGRAGIGSYCGNYSQCANSTPNSFCYMNTCQCQSQYILLGSVCTKRLGEHCYNTTQCQVPYSYCNGSYVCGCQSGYVQQTTTSCVWSGAGPAPTTTPRPAVSCNTVGCASYGSGAYCNSATGYCYCHNGYMLDRNFCYFVIDRIDATCDASTQICYLKKTGNKGVECNNRKCQCMKGFKESKDKLACNSATSLMATTSVMLLMLFLSILS